MPGGGDLGRIPWSRALEPGETDGVGLTAPPFHDPQRALEPDVPAEKVVWFARAEEERHETVKV